MTLEEARKIAAVIGTVGHGCSTCIQDALELMRRQFPDFRWEYMGDRAEKVADKWESEGREPYEDPGAFHLECGASRVSVEPLTAGE